MGRISEEEKKKITGSPFTLFYFIFLLDLQTVIDFIVQALPVYYCGGNSDGCRVAYRSRKEEHDPPCATRITV